MRYFDAYLQREAVQTVISVCRESDAVQGIIVELEPYWLMTWRLGERRDPNNPLNSFESSVPLLPDFRLAPWWDLLSEVLSEPWQPVRAPQSKEIQILPKWWTEYAMRRGLRDLQWPVMLRICLYPRGFSDERPIPRFDNLDVNFTYEIRPIARMAAGPLAKHRPLLGGISIGVGPSDFGTLGGILRAPNQERYALTCAHVAKTGDQVYQAARCDGGHSASTIGSVSHSEIPPSFHPSKLSVPGYSAGAAKSVDAAIIPLPAHPDAKLEINSLGAVTSLFPDAGIIQWQAVTYEGRTSGVQPVQFRGRSPYYCLADASGQPYCFEELLTVRWPTTTPSSPPPIQAGDSGAWLCVSGASGVEWAAMAVGYDPALGFAVSATRLEAWWNSLGFTLSPM